MEQMIVNGEVIHIREGDVITEETIAEVTNNKGEDDDDE